MGAGGGVCVGKAKGTECLFDLKLCQHALVYIGRQERAGKAQAQCAFLNKAVKLKSRR